MSLCSISTWKSLLLFDHIFIIIIYSFSHILWKCFSCFFSLHGFRLLTSPASQRGVSCNSQSEEGAAAPPEGRTCGTIFTSVHPQVCTNEPALFLDVLSRWTNPKNLAMPPCIPLFSSAVHYINPHKCFQMDLWQKRKADPCNASQHVQVWAMLAQMLGGIMEYAPTTAHNKALHSGSQFNFKSVGSPPKSTGVRCSLLAQ